MNTEDLLNLYTESSFIKNLSKNIDSISNINGFSGSQISFIAGAIYNLNSSNHFFIFENKESALLFKNDFEIISKKQTSLFTTNTEKKNSAKEITQNTKSLFEINRYMASRFVKINFLHNSIHSHILWHNLERPRGSL